MIGMALFVRLSKAYTVQVCRALHLRRCIQYSDSELLESILCYGYTYTGRSCFSMVAYRYLTKPLWVGIHLYFSEGLSLHDDNRPYRQNLPMPLNPKKQRWRRADFEIGRRLGEGGFGCVFEAREIRTRTIYAVKIVDKRPLIVDGTVGLLTAETKNQYCLR